MKTIWLDGRLFSDLRSIYDYLDRTLGFPDYFGNNLDALHDVLTETAEDVEIIITYKNALLKSVYNGDILIRVLEDSAQENGHLKFYIFP